MRPRESRARAFPEPRRFPSGPRTESGTVRKGGGLESGDRRVDVSIGMRIRRSPGGGRNATRPGSRRHRPNSPSLTAKPGPAPSALARSYPLPAAVAPHVPRRVLDGVVARVGGELRDQRRGLHRLLDVGRVARRRGPSPCARRARPRRRLKRGVDVVDLVLGAEDHHQRAPRSVRMRASSGASRPRSPRTPRRSRCRRCRSSRRCRARPGRGRRSRRPGRSRARTPACSPPRSGESVFTRHSASPITGVIESLARKSTSP